LALDLINCTIDSDNLLMYNNTEQVKYNSSSSDQSELRSERASNGFGALLIGACPATGTVAMTVAMVRFCTSLPLCLRRMASYEVTSLPKAV
jgi:hypothetical protein